MSVTLPYVRRSAIGAVMLGLGRALGETMAVTFIIGNSHNLPKSLFDAGSTIASTIANEFNEATGAMHTSALIAWAWSCSSSPSSCWRWRALLLGRHGEV